MKKNPRKRTGSNNNNLDYFLIICVILNKRIAACILMKGAATAKVPNFLFRERSREKSIAYFNQKVTEDEEVRQRIKAVQIPLG
jgi:uncharacterized protein involved in tolerance to divalent cations